MTPEFHEETDAAAEAEPYKPKPIAPIARPPHRSAEAGPMSISSAKALAIIAPRPEYPYEARSNITGSGVCVVTVDMGSGA